jgi:hypothetical protein
MRCCGFVVRLAAYSNADLCALLRFVRLAADGLGDLFFLFDFDCPDLSLRFRALLESGRFVVLFADLYFADFYCFIVIRICRFLPLNFYLFI